MSKEQKTVTPFKIVDGKLVPMGPMTFKEVQPEPKKYHHRNRPGHVRPLRKKEKR
jgi:hypothetical protein